MPYTKTPTILSCLLLGIALPSVQAQDRDADEMESPPHVALLNSIIENLEETSYQHKTDVRESGGIAHADCSGLVRYVLRETMPKHYEELRDDQGGSLSKNYYHYFVSLDKKGTRRWERVEHFENVRAGDIIVYASNGLTERGTTGHVMTAMSSPEEVSRNVYRLEIADSARSPHAEDTREKFEGRNGVGKGTMWFGTDDSGRPVSWWWSNPKFKPNPKDPSSILGIAVGRPK